MRLEFDATVDDFAACQERFQPKLPAVRRAQHVNTVSAALLSGLVLFVVIPDALLVKLVFGAAGAAAAAAVMPPWQAYYARRFQRSLAEQTCQRLSSSRVIVELRPEGLFVAQGTVETLFRWEGMESIEETADRYFVLGPQSVVSVPLRAFVSPHQAREFLAEAKQRSRPSH